MHDASSLQFDEIFPGGIDTNKVISSSNHDIVRGTYKGQDFFYKKFDNPLLAELEVSYANSYLCTLGIHTAKSVVVRNKEGVAVGVLSYALPQFTTFSKLGRFDNGEFVDPAKLYSADDFEKYLAQNKISISETAILTIENIANNKSLKFLKKHLELYLKQQYLARIPGAMKTQFEAYCGEEDDFHGENWGVYYNEQLKKWFWAKIDHDMSYWSGLTSKIKGGRFLGFIDPVDYWAVTTRDLESFPELQDANPWYWPTKSRLATDPSKNYSEESGTALLDVCQGATHKEEWPNILIEHLLLPTADIAKFMISSLSARYQDEARRVLTHFMHRQQLIKLHILQIPGVRDRLISLQLATTENLRETRKKIITSVVNSCQLEEAQVQKRLDRYIELASEMKLLLSSKAESKSADELLETSKTLAHELLRAQIRCVAPDEKGEPPTRLECSQTAMDPSMTHAGISISGSKTTEDMTTSAESKKVIDSETQFTILRCRALAFLQDQDAVEQQMTEAALIRPLQMEIERIRFESGKIEKNAPHPDLTALDLFLEQLQAEITAEIKAQKTQDQIYAGYWGQLLLAAANALQALTAEDLACDIDSQRKGFMDESKSLYDRIIHLCNFSLLTAAEKTSHDFIKGPATEVVTVTVRDYFTRQHIEKQDAHRVAQALSLSIQYVVAPTATNASRLSTYSKNAPGSLQPALRNLAKTFILGAALCIISAATAGSILWIAGLSYLAKVLTYSLGGAAMVSAGVVHHFGRKKELAARAETLAKTEPDAAGVGHPTNNHQPPPSPSY